MDLADRDRLFFIYPRLVFISPGRNWAREKANWRPAGWWCYRFRHFFFLFLPSFLLPEYKPYLGRQQWKREERKLLAHRKIPFQITLGDNVKCFIGFLFVVSYPKCLKKGNRTFCLKFVRKKKYIYIFFFCHYLFLESLYKKRKTTRRQEKSYWKPYSAKKSKMRIRLRSSADFFGDKLVEHSYAICIENNNLPWSAVIPFSREKRDRRDSRNLLSRSPECA